MKNITLLSIIALLGVSVSHAQVQFEEVETSVSISKQWSGDYSGYGISLKADVPVSENRHHFVGVETIFGSLKDEYSSSTTKPTRRSTRTTNRKANTSIDQYFLFLNYTYRNTFIKDEPSGLFYYGGAGVGLAYFDLSGNSTQEYYRGSVPFGSGRKENLSAHEFTPAGQAFLGLGYRFNERIAIRAGGKALLAHSIHATSSKGTVLARTDNLQYTLELALSIKF